MTARLKGRVAIVTGAGAVGPGWGNGKATAVLFAREGAAVFAVDRDLDAAEGTRAIIEREGGTCATHRADVSRASDVTRLVEACLERFGRIDVLHNNVGIVELGGCVDTPEDVWDRVMAVNVKSMFLTCRAVLPHMAQQGSGAIVNISSVAAIRQLGISFAAYSTSKAAILQLTRSIALEYADRNIRANVVLPGLMHTPMVERSLGGTHGAGGTDALVAERNRRCPMGRMGDAWDVAHAALFLASDEAGYVTGAELVVDGGLSCRAA